MGFGQLKRRASTHGGRPRRFARKLKPHPKATLSPVVSGFLFFVLEVHMQNHSTSQSKVRGQVQQGITKQNQDAYAWNIVLSGQQLRRTDEEFQG